MLKRISPVTFSPAVYEKQSRTRNTKLSEDRNPKDRLFGSLNMFNESLVSPDPERNFFSIMSPVLNLYRFIKNTKFE